MRALQISAPGKVGVVDVNPAGEPAAGHVAVRVEMVGLCGSDLNLFRGRNPLASFPRIPGHEVAGVLLAEASTEAGRLPAGTCVTVLPYTSCGRCASCRNGRVNACAFNQTLGVQRDGALCEVLSVPVEKIYAANLSLRELALVEPLSVGCHAVARGRVRAEDTVAVLGCGGVGLGAVAAAAFRGARVIAIDQDDAKLDVARQAGARELIHAARQDVHAELQRMTAGDGPECVIEAIGLPQTFRQAVEEVAFTGRVVYIGYAKEEVAYETRLFVQKELDILGSRNALPADFREVIAMLEAGAFPVDAAISAVVPMEEAGEWLQRWSDDPSRIRKLLVQVSEAGG